MDNIPTYRLSDDGYTAYEVHSDDLTGCDDRLDANYEDNNGGTYSGDEFHDWVDYHGLMLDYTYEPEGLTDGDIADFDD